MKQTNNYITREEVFGVCDEYWARYSRVATQKEVRVALGNRGSIGTINKYINEWKKLDENVEKIISTYGLKFPVNALEVSKKLYAIGFYDGDTSANSEQIKFLEEENEKLREELMGYQTTYQEMKGKLEGYEKNHSELLNTVQKQVAENVEIKSEMDKMKREFSEALAKMSQNK